MKARRSIAAAIAMITAMLLVASACGGGASETSETAEPTSTAASSEDASSNVDGDSETDSGSADSGSADSGSTGDSTEVDATDASEPQVDPDDPWAVTVLNVNEGVQIVPAFDAPNGEPTILYDINAVDDIELEYPLYGTTSFDNRLALVVEEFDDTGAWARVMVPIRPNGTTAWVQTDDFTVQTHNYRIIINLSENNVEVYQGDELLIEQLAVVGSESLPTPLVRSYIDEKIPGEPFGAAYGDWILSIAAFSETLGTYGGGSLPKLAIQGTDEPELMGQSISSGGIRVPNEVVSFIADTVPVGTIVEIVA